MSAWGAKPTNACAKHRASREASGGGAPGGAKPT